jgi:Domain of unknown function (DUF4149)
VRTLVVGLVTAAWLGAAILLAASVAPAAFAVLPSRTLAGAVVGRVLPVVFITGAAIGFLAAIAEIANGPGEPIGVATLVARWRVGAELVMSACCAAAQWVIGPRIERVRATIDGAVDALALDDPRRVAFGRLHGLSVAWLGAAIVAGVIVVVCVALSTRNKGGA